MVPGTQLALNQQSANWSKPRRKKAVSVHRPLGKHTYSLGPALGNRRAVLPAPSPLFPPRSPKLCPGKPSTGAFQDGAAQGDDKAQDSSILTKCSSGAAYPRNLRDGNASTGAGLTGLETSSPRPRLPPQSTLVE